MLDNDTSKTQVNPTFL